MTTNAVMGRPDWDDWFMGMCFWTSMRSPDPHTKHGAVLCNSNHQILGVGYNGFPRGCKDTELPTTRPEKYDVIIHAEDNCLMNSQNLLFGDNYRMYITGFPCIRCFVKIMQYNITQVIYGPLSSACVPQIDKERVMQLSGHKKIELREYSGIFLGQKNIDLLKGLLLPSE